MKDRNIILGWLTGIIDGEGCLYGKYSSQSKTTMHLRLTIDASSLRMIDKVCEILTSYGINHRKSKRAHKQKLHHKQSYLVDVDTKQDLLKLLTLITRSLVVKQAEAQLMLDYLLKSCQQSKYKPTEEDLLLVPRLKELKKCV